jgi:metalloendopeptidase OMA1, mitochondrial
MQPKRLIILVAILTALLMAPVTGRGEDSEDLKFGFFVDRLTVASQTVVFNEQLNKRITDIGRKVARASEKPLPQYTFRVINNPIINAYSAAGGYIYLNTGMLDVLENEDELAAVLGHEIAHSNHSHQIKGIVSEHRTKVAGEIMTYLLSSALAIGLSYGVASGIGSGVKSPAAQMLSSAASGAAGSLGGQLGGEIGVAMTISIIKGYGERQELEADSLGVQAAAKAGYNPEAFLAFQKRLISIRDRLGIGKQNYLSSFIKASPGLEKRVQELEKVLAGRQRTP